MMKIAHALQDSFKQFEKLTPNSNKNTTKDLEEVKSRLQSLPDIDKMYTKLQKKVESTIKQVFKLNDTQLQEFNFDVIKEKLKA